jgi:iron complex transport system ATP-binding protein
MIAGCRLETSALRVAIGGRTLVEALDARFEAGQSWALLGANGAGKTLLIETLAGLRAASGGTVTLEGRAIGEWPRTLLATRVGVLLQDEPADYWGSVAEYAALGRHPHGDRATSAERVAAALAQLDLATFAARRYRSLSGGERQRARLAQLVVQDPAVLLLDEPLNHLDLRHQGLVLALIGTLAAAGKLVIASLHDPRGALERCSHSLLVYDSARTEHGPSARVVRSESIQRLYRLDGPPAGLS